MVYKKLEAYPETASPLPTVQFLTHCRDLGNVKNKPMQILKIYYACRDIIARDDIFEADRIRVAFIKKVGELYNPAKIAHLNVGISELFCAAIAAHEEISDNYGQIADFYNEITQIDEIIDSIKKSTENFAGYKNICPEPDGPTNHLSHAV